MHKSNICGCGWHSLYTDDDDDDGVVDKIAESYT